MIKNAIRELICHIIPFDKVEQEHIEDALNWINSGAEIFRIQKPDVPNKHLVSYFCLFDMKVGKVLLVDHKKARLWLPTGGHVDPGEHPATTVSRECVEELGVSADFQFDKPIFLTCTQTVGLTAGHTDVSLWYVLKGDSKTQLLYDKAEFDSVRWFDLDQIPFEKSDPHMRRFIAKVIQYFKKDAR